MCLDHYFVCFFRYIMLFFPCSNPVYYQSCIFCIFVVFWVFSFRKLPFSGYSVDCYDLYSGCSCFYFLFPYALTNLKCLFHLFPPNQSVKTKFFLRNIRRMHYVFDMNPSANYEYLCFGFWNFFSALELCQGNNE